MTIKSALLRGAAFGVLGALAVGATAYAQTDTTTTTTKTVVKRHVVRHPAHKVVEKKVVVREESNGEVSALRAEVEELKARLDAQAQQNAATQAQVQEAAASAESAQEKIETIPEQVNVAIGQLPKPKNDKIYYKGVSITLGGFLEATNIYRDHNMVSDIATNFSQIPFQNNVPGHTHEDRFTAHQSRLSALVQGDAAPDVHLAMYGEFDFNAAAQTANSNETNSYQPRIRHLYGTVDWDNFMGEGFGFHLLAGQNWSLATLNTKGITPRNELTPPQIDAQYVPGFVFTRNPQVRVTGDFFDHTLWIAASAENAATTTTGTQPANSTVNAAGQSGFNSGNNVSLNEAPDLIAKVAYEMKPFGRSLHLEAFGVGRDFYDRHAPFNNVNGREDEDVWTSFGGASVVFQAIPTVLDLQASVTSGKGIGRYSASQLPDATFRSDGKLEPIPETVWLAGATWHATPTIDAYFFAGREQQDRTADVSIGTANYGLGNYKLDARACNFEVAAEAPAGSACNVQTKSIQQETVGFWHKFYQGSFGRAQWGMQYSYTERDSFSGVGNVSAKGDENIVMTSFRYYPF